VHQFGNAVQLGPHSGVPIFRLAYPADSREELLAVARVLQQTVQIDTSDIALLPAQPVFQMRLGARTGGGYAVVNLVTLQQIAIDRADPPLASDLA